LDIQSLSKSEQEALANKLLDIEWWAEHFLVEPTTLKPFKANFVQKEIFKAFKENRRVVIRVTRRSGKSHSLAVIALWACLIFRKYEVLVIAPDQGKVDEIFEKIRSFIRVSPAIQSSVLGEGSKKPQLIRISSGQSISRILGRTTGSSSRKGGDSLRSLGGDLILLDEAALFDDEDFKAMDAIIEGDKYRVTPTKTLAAATPMPDQNQFWRWCTDKELGWHEIHIPITKNPAYTPEEVERIRKSVGNQNTWESEYLAEFPQLGENAIPLQQITDAMRGEGYSTNHPKNGNPRVIGVDWDKFQAGVNISVVELSQSTGIHTVIYREEVPRGEYTLTNAVKRVINLNTVFNPEIVIVDRGYNEMGVEELKLFGKNHPESGLAEKVIGVSFSEKVTIHDPVSGAPLDKRFKGVMINNLLYLLEERKLIFDKDDEKFKNQLRGYRVVSNSVTGPKAASKDEHIIDAVGMACFALNQKYGNRFEKHLATKSYNVPQPEIVRSKAAIIQDREFFERMRSPINDNYTRSEWGRGSAIIRGRSINRSRF
jgi:hypothetical protein